MMKAQQFSESPLVSSRPACRPLIRRQSQSVDYYLQPTRANRAASKFVLCLGLLPASRRIAARMVEPRGFEPLTPTMPWWGECLSLKVRSGMIRFSALYSARRFLLWSWPGVLRLQPGLARIAGTISTPSPANKARPALNGEAREADFGLAGCRAVAVVSWWPSRKRWPGNCLADQSPAFAVRRQSIARSWIAAPVIRGGDKVSAFRGRVSIESHNEHGTRSPSENHHPSPRP
jgi:hypothetical protein